MGFLGRLIGKVRCPACGSFGRHPRDLESEEEIKSDNELYAEMFGSSLSEMNKPRESMGLRGMGKQIARAFVCSSCGHSFDLETEMIWSKTASHIGDKRAVSEYGKLQR